MNLPPGVLSGALLLQEVLPDTIVTVSSPTLFETVEGIAEIVIAATLLLTVIALALMVLGLKKRVNALVDETRTRVEPVMQRAENVAANVEYLSAVLREDVRMVHDSVRAVSDRLHQASDRMEERIEDFNALMEVVQGEAEDVFIGTAATARGVKAGVEALGTRSPRQERSGKEEPRRVEAPGSDRTAAAAEGAGPPPADRSLATGGDGSPSAARPPSGGRPPSEASPRTPEG